MASDQITTTTPRHPNGKGVVATLSGQLVCRKVAVLRDMRPTDQQGWRVPRPGTIAADIYALGVVLYQLLTGQLPFAGDSTLEVLRAVTNDEPVRPRRLQPRSSSSR